MFQKVFKHLHSIIKLHNCIIKLYNNNNNNNNKNNNNNNNDNNNNNNNNKKCETLIDRVNNNIMRSSQNSILKVLAVNRFMVFPFEYR